MKSVFKLKMLKNSNSLTSPFNGESIFATQAK
jgi:hypothetical protein